MTKKLFTLLFASLLFVSAVQAQLLKNIIKTATKDSSAGKVLDGLARGTGSLSSDEVASGLKEALAKGTEKSTQQLSSVNGFLQNAAIKILLPPDAQKVEKTLRTAGMGKLVDDAITSMNRAAEDAAKSAAPIFLSAIRQMTIQDAWGILRGADTSATHYLKTKTTDPLTTAFKPVIQQSLEKVNATKHWSDLANAYNKINLFSKQQLNPDLSVYVTGKALHGIFHEIALQEIQIRQNPAARTTDLLKKVFGQK